MYRKQLKLYFMTMHKLFKTLLAAVFTFSAFAVTAQKTTVKHISKPKTTHVMKTYLIERDIPNAGALSHAELKGISQKSCAVLKEMGPDIKWLQSYVTGDKIFCVYQAENEELIREHAKKGGFPANTITEIKTTISPATATNP